MRKNLKEARAAAGLTQQQMADKLGVSLRQYQRIEAGSHYIELSGEELTEFRSRVENFYSVGKTANKAHFWTEKGALLHAKSLNTDKAWEVYEYLVDFYFRAKEEKAIIPVNTRTEKVPEGIDVKPGTAYSMGQLEIELGEKVDIFVKLIHLVEKLRGEVHFVTFKSKSEGMMVSDHLGLRIGIRSEMDFDRYIYNIAYELAHYYLHFDKGDVITSARNKEYEEQADRGAKMLLTALGVEG